VTFWFAILLVWVLPVALVTALVTMSVRNRRPDPQGAGRDPN